MRQLLVRALAGVCLLTGVSFSGPRPDSGSTYGRITWAGAMIHGGVFDDPQWPIWHIQIG